MLLFQSGKAAETKKDEWTVGDEEEYPEVIRTTYEPPPAPPAMEPLYQLNDDGSLPGRLTERENMIGTELYPQQNRVLLYMQTARYRVRHRARYV